MPLANYTDLQDSILQWLGRPGDPLLLPAVPDFITMFEAEARGRLNTRFAEQLNVELPGNAGVFFLPDDFAAIRRAMYNGVNLHFEPSFVLDELPPGGGKPSCYTIEGLQLRLAPPPDTALPVVVDYIQGLPSLGVRITSNWLLKQSPDLYLYGSLAAAEGYIGNDERVAAWLQLREAAFERVRQESVRGLAGGAPLRVRPAGATP